MHALTASEILNVWERGRAQSPPRRALSLLSLAAPETPLEQLAQWTIGQRDEQLLALHEKIFGPTLIGLAKCAECHQSVEMEIPVAELRNGSSPNSTSRFTLQRGDCEVQFRLLNSDDIMGLTPDGDVEKQRQALLSRCVTHAANKGMEIASDRLPGEIISALSERMAELDSYGDMELVLTCPNCGHGSRAPLDIGSFLWSEIQFWAHRMMCDVHVLASAYGWREADILAMSQQRRQAYLELIER